MVWPMFAKANDMRMLEFVKLKIKYHKHRLKSDCFYSEVSISQTLFKRMVLVWTFKLSKQILTHVTVSN